MYKEKGVMAGAIAALILIVAVGIALGIHQNESLSAPSRILGLVVTVTEDTWKDELERSIEEAAELHDMVVMPIMAERNQNAQIDALRALIAYQADVIVFSPLVENGWDKVLSETEQAGIPVIAVDKAVRPGRGGITASYVGYDYYHAAVKAAQRLLLDTEGEAVILELCGTTGAYSVREITRGFRETLEKDGRYHIDYSVCGEFMRSKGKEIVNNMLRNDYQIDIIISHNDAMTLGAVNAITEAGKIPGKDIKIYAFGGAEEVQTLVQEGKIECLVRCNPAAVGVKTLEAAGRLMWEEQTQEDVELLIDTLLITKEDWAQ
ncbi:substrate-binding domain-containing protein [Sinanaerobacter chloroacetimidivorans]|uniref:Substrate-binding domain-containing protein n=1 Tax=Sinanaerobacter chloroacetimidivorans TaxID=2818044 RepID=A0A8J7W787_9FIRM|nr:substrate-binding domain-containing protein [Sinanaerobacter chloroacetimidivorans]MBR0600185.1 substrate-binding domain-containing protein [Sinanaerobacter chloroacetimidivorans]